MKKIFPLIVVLITLSVLGIIFIQMSWINNAISLRQKQREQDINRAILQIRTNFHDLFLKYTGNVGWYNEETKNFYLQSFTTQVLTPDEIQQGIQRALVNNNIKDPFDYSITNIFQAPLVTSSGFLPEYYKSTRDVLLTPEKASFRETLHLYIKEDRNYILRKMGWMIAASILFTGIITSAFALTVRTMFTQKKLSEIKSDFINNMTHELKTPLATISLAIDALTNEKVIHDTEKIRYYSSMIKDENKRMNKQVEKILQAARIEKQDITLKLQRINAHDTIRKVADNLSLQIQERNGTLTLNLEAPRFEIDADEVHFSNIIFNLLDNAIKYSGDAPVIDISTEVSSGMLAIKVKDNGIGMNKETQTRVFEKFYRAHTGNLHNVKGFGLGLSYVKAMVEAHGGRAKVESTQGKGSTFTVFFPLAN
ncbi:MAG: histidine kinase [Flavipsychrobacter sp.]|jgi:two-component system phosphate regulon sensor histidine kinase PhoR|nr:histidine kinase [Flavipsychrobacter sp.]